MKSYRLILSDYYNMELDEKKAFLDKLYYAGKDDLVCDLLYDTDPCDQAYVNPYNHEECGYDSVLAAELS